MFFTQFYEEPYLLTSFPGCEITYEPKGIDKNGKNCDFEVIYNKKRYLVEIKSFHPKWESKQIPEKYIAENNIVTMDGECYHSYQATRGHLVDVTYHTEQKVENYEGQFVSVLGVPNGFHLDVEDLRDFVFIYRHGEPRADDPLGPMTMHNLKEPFIKSIDQFWALPFPQESFQLEEDAEVTIVAPLKDDDTKLKI